MIEFFAKEEHFEDHLRPVFDKVRELGYQASWVREKDTPDPKIKLAVTASVSDHNLARKAGKMVFFCEHGAGQSYNSRHTSYAGGPNREAVCMFLSPGPHVTAQNKRFYPNIPSVEVGLPKLDYLHKDLKREPADPPLIPKVCFSFHWDCKVCPETRSGFDHFKESILKIYKLKDQFEVIGHCHPRAREQVVPFYKKHGIPFVENFADVLEQADIYACDNSSTIFEFASIGKPVVFLNPPMYRKNVHHGLRFWKYADLGPHASGYSSLLQALHEVSVDSREVKDDRMRRIREVYSEMDGNAAQRAAEAILEFVEEVVRVEREGNLIKVIKTAASPIYGLLDKGQTILIFPKYAIIYDTRGKYIRRAMYKYAEDPSDRIRTLIKAAPRNYALVEPDLSILNNLEVDLTEKDYSAVTSEDEFESASRPYSEEDIYILQKVKEGLTKTKIVYKSREFKTASLVKAWDRLIQEETIIPGQSQYSWEINSDNSY